MGSHGIMQEFGKSYDALSRGHSNKFAYIIIFLNIKYAAERTFFVIVYDQF